MLTTNRRAFGICCIDIWVQFSIQVLLFSNLFISFFDPSLNPCSKWCPDNGIENCRDVISWQLLHFSFLCRQVLPYLRVLSGKMEHIVNTNPFIMWCFIVFDIFRLQNFSFARCQIFEMKDSHCFIATKVCMHFSSHEPIELQYI